MGRAELGSTRVCKSRDEGREFAHNFFLVTEVGIKVKY